MINKNSSLPEKEKWMLPNEDIEINVRYTEGKVLVQFNGFDTEEDSKEYATTLAEVLPVLLYGTTRVQ